VSGDGRLFQPGHAHAPGRDAAGIDSFSDPRADADCNRSISSRHHIPMHRVRTVYKDGAIIWSRGR
jgi:hypothetical protein